MTIVYFADGEVLDDGEIRRQCLRIPEVQTAVNKLQKAHDLDLVSVITLDDEFRKLNEFQQKHMKDLIQQGIFERFCRLRLPYSEIFYRSQFRSAAAVVKEIKFLLRGGEPCDIYVVGPGMDEVPQMVNEPHARWIDVIDNDPQLQWFWGELRKAANA